MKPSDGMTNAITAWLIAALLGAFVLAMLLMLAHWTATQAIFAGIVTFLVAGTFFTRAFLSPLPGPVVNAPAATVISTTPPAKIAVVPEVAPATVAVRAVAADGKPPMLAAARDGTPDDLKIIRGVGPKLEQMLHGMGIYHFDQIADWQAAELDWVDDNLEGFKGRASRDAWVPQAKVLAAGGTEAEAFAAADAAKG